MEYHNVEVDNKVDLKAKTVEQFVSSEETHSIEPANKVEVKTNTLEDSNCSEKSYKAEQNGNTNSESRITVRCSNMYKYVLEQMPTEMEEFMAGGQIKSGYSNLDVITNLYPGMYVIGAISSLGKTTFIHQMADQMAETGSAVLYFSMEQSTLELASKSLSRTMAKRNSCTPMTSLQIRRNGSDPRVKDAISDYILYADNLYIVECGFNANIDFIEDTVRRFIEQKGKKPIVVIDYLQVIQPPTGSRMNNSKDLIDMYVRRLKQLQSENKLVMIVISSLNRQNYLMPVDFESFKESGGIEYTADVVWGLQLEVLHTNDAFTSPKASVSDKRQVIKEAKVANPRRIELVCLKNRFGIASYSCMFEYFPQFDYFRPILSGKEKALLRSTIDLDGLTKLSK